MNQVRSCTLYIFLLGWLMSSAASAQTLAESVGHILGGTTAQSVLLVLGAIFLGLSIVTMGSGLAEFLCFLSFTFLFIGRYTQGEDLWLPLALLVIGIAMAALEIFVIPGFGIGGLLSGAAFVALSVIVAESLQMGVVIFMVSTVLGVSAALLALKLVPHLCVTRKLFVLEAPKASIPASSEGLSLPLAIGERGRTVSSLRPVGSAKFGGESFEVASRGELLPKDTEVEIVEIESGKIWVRSVPPSQPHDTEGSL